MNTTTIDADGLKHELGHALGALLSRHAEASVISHDGVSWRNDPVWEKGYQPNEQETMCSALGGMLFPKFASAEDRFLFSVCPPDLRDSVIQILEAEVKPKIEAFTDDELSSMLEILNSGTPLLIGNPGRSIQ